jgi:hypothetical protein
MLQLLVNNMMEMVMTMIEVLFHHITGDTEGHEYPIICELKFEPMASQICSSRLQ